MQKIFKCNLIKSIFAVSVLLVAVYIFMPRQAFAFSGGYGTSGDPYKIENCLQLSEMQNDLSAEYLLIDNIDCSDTVNWNGYKGFAPVGDDSMPFTGKLDGNNKTISNLYMVWADDEPGNSGTDRNYVGLFGYISNATVNNLNLVNIMSKGYEHVGGLAGYAQSSTITNVNVNVALPDNNCAPGTCIWARWGTYGGGIVGTADATSISSVMTGGPVKGSGTHIGGIAGQAINNSVIANASSSSHVDGGYRIGGIAGYLDNSSISSSTASGYIECVYDDGYKQGNNAGGLVGEVAGGTIQSSLATGAVSGWGLMGGLVGKASGASIIGNSSATGSVSGGMYIGGFVGFMTDAQIYYSFAKGNVLGTYYNVGGFVGYMSGGEITDSYARGNVTSDSSFAGGFVGTIYGGTIQRTYSTGIVTIPESGDERAGSFSSEAYEDGNDIVLTDSFASGGVNAPAGEGGFIANLNTSGMEFANNYFDITRTAQEYCRAVPGEVDGCTGVNANNSDPDYFIGNSTSAVFVNWNFDGIWNVVADGYPCLSWEDDCALGASKLPEIECLQTTATIDSVTGSCTTSPQLQGETTWELRYRQEGASSWTNLTSQNGDTFDVTVNDLAQATNYEIGFRFINDLGTSGWGLILAKTDSDLNGDGILDLSQPNVSAHINPVTNKYVAIDVGADCTLTSVDMVKESDLAAQDAAYNYDNGLFDFTADCSVPTTTIKLYYYGVSKINLVARKFNSLNNSFFNLTGTYGATIEEQTIGGQAVLVVTYQLSDNGTLDDDPSTGHIADPAGLASAVVGAPNTGLRLQ